MDADGLVRAIRAALDETEAKARRAADYGQGVWTYEDGDYGPKVRTEGDTTVYNGWERDINTGVWRCDDPEDGCDDLCAQWRAEGEHIALHDPAAVLRRVAADRELVDAHDAAARFAASTGSIHAYTTAETWYRAVIMLARGLGINPEKETPGAGPSPTG